MFLRKFYFYALLLTAATACTKQEIIPSSASSVALSGSSYGAALQTTMQTTFGLMEEKTTDAQKRADMKTANVNIVRLTIFLSETTVNKVIDDFLAKGYNVQISISWSTGTLTNRGFPTRRDTSFLRAQATAFFKYYADRKKQIPFVAIENEWDHEVQSGYNLQDYINELSIMTSVGHKYGFKIADGGITYASLQRWTYSQLPATEQEQWKQKYYVGLNDDYDGFLGMVNSYIAAAKKIDFDYSNVHWCNQTKCENGYRTATQKFMIACNKTTTVCNEFGVKTNSLTLFTQTVNEINGNALYAIAYSGSSRENDKIELTTAMFLVLATL